MNAPTSPWDTADKAYQLHHFSCAQCCAAGVMPGRQERCPEGLALWTQYLNAGDPPHFTWLRQRRKK